MSFYEIDKTEEFLLSLLPNDIEADFADLLVECESMFVPVISKTGAQLLKLITKLTKPSTIIEIGTGIGYSGLVMLRESSAYLYTIELKESNALTARDNFKKYGYGDRAEVMLGDASDILPLLEVHADLIFVDGPKGKYYEFYPILKKLLNNGGIIVCDNVLYFKRVSGEKETPASKKSITDRLKIFFEMLKNDQDMITSILPIGDGVSISYKK